MDRKAFDKVAGSVRDCERDYKARMALVEMNRYTPASAPSGLCDELLSCASSSCLFPAGVRSQSVLQAALCPRAQYLRDSLRTAVLCPRLGLLVCPSRLRVFVVLPAYVSPALSSPLALL